MSAPDRADDAPLGLSRRLSFCAIPGCRGSAGLDDRAPRIVTTDSHHTAGGRGYATPMIAAPPQRIGAKSDSPVGKSTGHGPGC